MEVRLAGTAGSGGWPQHGCGCASCARLRAAGRSRAPARVVVDGRLLIGSGDPPAGESQAGDSQAGTLLTGFRVRRMPGAWDVTGPDGGRLLVADGSGVTPDPPSDAAPYDVVLLDLAADPAQLGALRSRGLAGGGAVAAVLHADHRVPSEEELARRCGFWGVVLPDDGDVLTAPHRGPAPAAAEARPSRVLVLGGARSGKSRHAELRLAGEPAVTYLAAGPYPDGAQPDADSEWAERVAAHRSRRPPWWRTVESADAAAALRSVPGALLFDGVGTWLAAVMTAQHQTGNRGLIAEKADELVEAWRQTPARVVAVSDEVGSGVHPPTEVGRMFRDQLGWLNQRLAAESDEVVLVVAGRPVTLPS